MEGRHLPAVVAAVLTLVVVGGVGLLGGSDDGETATGPSTSASTTTTTDDEPRSTTTTADAPTTTEPTSTSTGVTTTSGPASTSSTTTRPTPTTARPTTTTAPETTTTAPRPPFFEIAAGPTTPIPGCGGSTSVTIRNGGQQIGVFGLEPSREWVEITAPQLTLAPGGETIATISVPDHNGPDSFSVRITNRTTGEIDGSFAVGLEAEDGLDLNCQPR